MRRGPPLPLAIFMGRATTVKPEAGRRRRWARFSNAGRLAASPPHRRAVNEPRTRRAFA